MKLFAAFLTLTLTFLLVEASGAFDHEVTRRHMQILRRGARNRRSCTEGHAPEPVSKTPVSTTHSTPADTEDVQVKTHSSSHGSCTNKAAGPVSAKGGPNGSQKYLNCGIDGHGWNPPKVHMNEIVAVDLNSVRHTTFKSCSDEAIRLFYKHGAAHNIKPIILASFAMQESTCNPNTVGGGGEQGMMQITKDKCKGRSPAACRELDFNIGAGAEYFAKQLKAFNGNVIETVGSYNGYFKGMTYADATRAARTKCCRCQNNLDYLQQYFNGWLQGYDVYDSKIRLGTYFNLDVCNRHH